MHQHLRQWPQIRGMRWQGSQVRALKRQTRGNGITSPGHNALLIRETVLSECCVDGFQVTALWERHKVVAACMPHQIFDASFVPTGMHIGKERDPPDKNPVSAEKLHRPA